jgi:phosphoglucosamine mutase
MQNGNYNLGGEESGHIIFSKYASTGDGLITAIKIMEVFIESKLPVSKLCDGFVMYPQLVKNVKVADKDIVMCDEDVLAAVKEVEEQLGGEGRVLLRRSGTEPVVRVMVEAKGETLCNVLSEKVVKAIKEKGYAQEM